MELHKAIKEIIASKGAEMICNPQIIYYLLDYQAFKEKPATKLILRAIIESGYAKNILALINTTGWETKFKQYQHELIDSCGFKENLTQYVFNSIAYGLSMIGTVEDLKISENNVNADSEGFINGEENTTIENCQNVNGCRKGDFAELQLPHGVEVGKPCSVILPSREIVTAKLEIIIDGMAGVRLSGFRRMKVPISSLIALLKDAE